MLPVVYFSQMSYDRTMIIKKSIYLIVPLFIIFAACGKTETKVSYYENGSKKEEIELKEGKRHGTLKLYYKNGKLFLILPVP